MLRIRKILCLELDIIVVAFVLICYRGASSHFVIFIHFVVST